MDRNHGFNELITLREILSYQSKRGYPRAVENREAHGRTHHTLGSSEFTCPPANHSHGCQRWAAVGQGPEAEPGLGARCTREGESAWEGASRGSVLERQCLSSGLRGKLSVHAVMGTWGTAERRGAMEAVRYRA